jgi:hypothetical protein
MPGLTPRPRTFRSSVCASGRLFDYVREARALNGQ